MEKPKKKERAITVKRLYTEMLKERRDRNRIRVRAIDTKGNFYDVTNIGEEVDELIFLIEPREVDQTGTGKGKALAEELLQNGASVVHPAERRPDTVDVNDDAG